MILKFISVFLIFVQMVTIFPPVDSTQEVMDIDAKLNKLIIQNNANEAAPFYTDDFILITSGGKMITRQSTKLHAGHASRIGYPSAP